MQGFKLLSKDCALLAQVRIDLTLAIRWDVD
jgi:hypothetical protein